MAVNVDELKLVDVTLETPESVEGQPKSVHFVIEKKTAKIIRRITDGLIRSRKIPANIEDITIGDPMAILINQTKNWISPNEAVAEAKNYYKSQLEQIAQDAYMLAITYETVFTKEPKPYPPDESTEKDPDLPAWVESVVNLPVPTRDLKDPYERRLKQIIDFLDECGPMYQIQFRAQLTNSIGNALRVIGGVETDPDGFQPSTTDRPLSVSPSTNSGNDGNADNGASSKKESTRNRKVRVLEQPTSTVGGENTEA